MESASPTDSARETAEKQFGVSLTSLDELVSTKSLDIFQKLGGIRGLEQSLKTDIRAGLSRDEDHVDALSSDTVTDDPNARRDSTASWTHRLSVIGHHHEPAHFTDRKNAFGENRLPRKKSKSIWKLLWDAFNDKLLFLLTAATFVSMAVGIYNSVDSDEQGSNVEWVDSVVIICIIIVIVLATAGNDWQKERRFQQLNEKKEERKVKITRSGSDQEISIYALLVGDLVHLEAGDVLPVDGVLVKGFGIRCDESAISGESGNVSKSGTLDYKGDLSSSNSKMKFDPFLLSGTTVAEGTGVFLVTAVGQHSALGKVMMSLRDEPQVTPLQERLGKIASKIIKFGVGAGTIFFVIIFIRYLTELGQFPTPKEKGQEFLGVFVQVVLVIIVSVPEGLALAVSLALAFATTRMLKDNNLVRYLRACETMGNATTICSDKTGTITTNAMTVVTGIISGHGDFDDASGVYPSQKDTPNNASSATAFVKNLSRSVKELLKDSIVLNSSAIETSTDEKTVFIGSSTESALLRFARTYLGMGRVHEERENAKIVYMYPFDSDKKAMAIVIKKPDGGFRMLIKGAPEVMLEKCIHMIVTNNNHKTSTLGLGSAAKLVIKNKVEEYARHALRGIGLAYKDFDSWPPISDVTGSSEQFEPKFDEVVRGLVFIGVFGIHDPLRPGVTEAIQQCQTASVFVRMVTGDNFLTATAIARSCGIYTPGGIAMDGSKFRKLTDSQLDMALPKLQVLARSTPADKRRLVARLQHHGDTVAVTGDGTNDALALKTADVGFAMGIAGTEVAKEAASIILLDDNFASIVKAMLWGRTINDATKKFLQFQFTINIGAGFLIIISVLNGGTDASVFSTVQLLWLNLIMDAFSALALATDYPLPSMLNRKPEPRTAPIITTPMWKMVIGQAIYQMLVVLTIHYAGIHIFEHTGIRQDQVQTMVFNVYMWMQICNQINSRRVDNNLNIFEGLFRNPFIIFVQVATIAGQIAIVFKGGEAFNTEPLTGAQWGYCLMFGFFTYPLGVLIRLVSDETIEEVGAEIDLGAGERKMISDDPVARCKRRHFYRRIYRRLANVARSAANKVDITDKNDGDEEEALFHRSRHNVSMALSAKDKEVDLETIVGALRRGDVDGSETGQFEVHPEAEGLHKTRIANGGNKMFGKPE